MGKEEKRKPEERRKEEGTEREEQGKLRSAEKRDV
jgi:hypothetical protein